MKPFNQSFLCRLVFGLLIGKGETNRELPLKVLYEIFAALALAGLLLTIQVLVISSEWLMRLNSVFLSDLNLLLEHISIILAFWLLWYGITRFGGLILPWDEFTIGLLGIAFTALLGVSSVYSDEVRIWAAKASQDDYTKLRIAVLVCHLCATLPPAFGLWRISPKH